VHKGSVACQDGFQGGSKITMRMPIVLKS
jgi:hypothetical protein